MATPSYTVPSTQAISLQLPQPAVNGAVVWSETPSIGHIIPTNDGQSALFSPGPAVFPLTAATLNSATAALVLTAVAASSGGTAVYTGTITGGAANALVGQVFVVAGFVGAYNNGTFLCTASLATTLTLSNVSAQAETHAGTAQAAVTHTTYTGTFGTAAIGNGLAGVSIVVAGMADAANNGTFTILSSTGTQVGVTNASGVTRTTQTGTATAAAVTSTTVTAVITPSVGVWKPGHLYRVGDQIVDVNGHTQQVTAGSRNIQSVFTPYAGKIPGSISMLLTGGSATSTAPSGIPLSGGSVAITGISATVPSTFVVGQTVVISGMTTTAAPLNGSWELLAVGANSLTLYYNGSPLSAVSLTAASTVSVSGDATQFGTEYGGSIVSGTVQYGTVLNQGQGINGDWPAGASSALTGNTKKPYPTTGATVIWVGCGFSAGPHSYGALGVPSFDGPQQDFSTPTPGTGYGNDTRAQYATYSEIGAHGLIPYYDDAGNLITSGWQVAKGTQTFSESLILTAPTFSTGGGTTVDGELTWTDEGLVSTVTYNANLTVSATAAPPVGSYVTLGA